MFIIYSLVVQRHLLMAARSHYLEYSPYSLSHNKQTPYMYDLGCDCWEKNFNVHVLTRDEKEERKKKARSNKPTRQSNTAHPRQSLVHA